MGLPNATQEFEEPADLPIFEDARLDIESAFTVSNRHDVQKQDQLELSFPKKPRIKTKCVVALIKGSCNTQKTGALHATVPSVGRCLNELAPSSASLAQALHCPHTSPRQGQQQSAAENSGSADRPLDFLKGRREGHAKNDQLSISDKSLASSNNTVPSNQLAFQQKQQFTQPYTISCSPAFLNRAKQSVQVEVTQKSRGLELVLPSLSNSVQQSTPFPDTSVSVTRGFSCEEVKSAAGIVVQIFTTFSLQDANISNNNKALGSVAMDRSNGSNSNVLKRQRHETQREVGEGQQFTSAGTDNRSRYIRPKPWIDKGHNTSRRLNRNATKANADNNRSSHQRGQNFSGNIARNASVFKAARHHHPTPFRNSAPSQPINRNTVQTQDLGSHLYNSQYGTLATQHPAADVSRSSPRLAPYYDHSTSAMAIVQTPVGRNFPHLILVPTYSLDSLDKASNSF